LLDKSQRFRDWIQTVNPDDNLVRDYFKEVTAEGWIAKLPAKIVRYIVASAVGLGSPAAGLSLAAADSFLLDKIFAGWRPNHFVDRKLKPFLKPKD
jgi:hypothetical protein